MLSEQSSIIYNIRLPKDPAPHRDFDINRVTAGYLYGACQIADIFQALVPICKLVGLKDCSTMLSNNCTADDWACAHPRQRVYWILRWLVREDADRKGKRF